MKHKVYLVHVPLMNVNIYVALSLFRFKELFDVICTNYVKYCLGLKQIGLKCEYSVRLHLVETLKKCWYWFANDC